MEKTYRKKSYEKVNLTQINKLNLGVFYKIDEKRKEITFCYDSDTELKIASDLIMEYYDKKENNEENKFLDNWEIVFGGDTYSIAKMLTEKYIAVNKVAIEKELEKATNMKVMGDTSEEREENIKQKKLLMSFLSKKIKNFEVQLDSFPTREEIEKGKNIKQFISTGVYIFDVVVGARTKLGIDDTVTKYYKKKLGKKGAQVLEYSAMAKNISGGDIGVDVSSTGLLTRTLSYLQSLMPEEEIELPETGITINISSDSARVVLLRNKNTGEFALAIEDGKVLMKIYDYLDSGSIPPDVFTLVELVKCFEKENKENFNISFTGLNNGAKMATILDIVYSENKKNTSVRGFVKSELSCIPPLFLVKEQTIKHFYDNELLYDSSKQQSEIIKKIGKVLISSLIIVMVAGPVGVVKIVVLGLVFDVIFGETYEYTKGTGQKKQLEKFIKILEDSNLILNGIVKSEIFEQKYDFVIEKDFYGKQKKEIIKNLNLETYIQLEIYKKIYSGIFKVSQSSENPDVQIIQFTTLAEPDIDLEIKVYNGEVIEKKKSRKDNLLTIKKDENGNIIEEYLEDIEIEFKEYDILGIFFLETLKNFYKYQQNIETINLNATYIKDGKKITYNKLTYNDSVEKCENKNTKGGEINFNEYLFFPYIQENGELGENLRKEFIGSFLRTVFSVGEKDKKKNNLNYDLSKELLKANNFLFLSTNKKSDVMNKCLRGRMEERKDLPHYDAVLEMLNKSNDKILEDFYEVIPYNENKGYLYIGHLAKDKKSFNPNIIGYTYNVNDKVSSMAVFVTLYYDSASMGLEDIKTTQVSNGAQLECSAGSAPLKLQVTSQSFYSINKELAATEEDSQGRINIVPQNTSCLLRANNPCIGLISTNKWTGCSKKTVNDKLLLISSSTCKCQCGGTISISSSNCNFIYSNE
ncbi:MAG: PAAR-like protein [Fusobacteriaceae bacterium]